MISYFIKSSLLLIIFYLIYRLFLKGEKRFIFNRFFLLSALILSLLVPLSELSLPQLIEEEPFLSAGVQTIEGINKIQTDGQDLVKEHKTQAFSIYWVYAMIAAMLLFRFLGGLWSLLFKNREKGQLLSGMQVYYEERWINPHSFFNRLFLHQSMKEERVEEAIVLHELAHYRQLHGIDLLLAELFNCFFWFNPFSWLIKKEIKTNHEYLADQKVMQNIAEEDYLQIILQYVRHKSSALLTSNFSFLSIKTRIKMIQKNRINKKKQGLKIGITLIVSLFCISLFSFNSKEIDRKIDQQATANFGLDLFKKPSGYPIYIERIRKVSSEFGMRTNPLSKTKKMHTGVDLLAEEGTQILASGKGTVVKVVHDTKGYGNHIVIQHNMKYKSLYAHLKSINVEVGDKIKEGTAIGIIGNSGTSIKTHLHYEIMEFGKKIDPNIKIGC